MDIIIRNGIIQNEESKRIREIKNKEGLLKKDYKNYIKGIPGPYYDLLDCHLCIPRKYNQIDNFTGPQNSKKIKLNDIKDFNKSTKYCSICHKEIKSNPCFSSKRKIFIEEDSFAKKVEVNFDLQKEFKKIKITCEHNYNNSSDLDLIMSRLNKTSIDINTRWHNLYEKIQKNNVNHNMNLIFLNYKSLQKKNINRFYKMVYKLIKEPVFYPISSTETKIIWPWDLTMYQKFKLLNPNYKSASMFSHRKNYKISENYVIIE